MKKILCLLGIGILLFCTACGKTEEENPLRDKIEADGDVTQITIYYDSAENEGECSIKDGYIDGYDILYQTKTQADVERIFAMLEGWSFEENEISNEDALLLACDIHVCFHGNKIMMSYSEQPQDDDYYGYLEGNIYYLPKELGDYIEKLLNE